MLTQALDVHPRQVHPHRAGPGFPLAWARLGAHHLTPPGHRRPLGHQHFADLPQRLGHGHIDRQTLAKLSWRGRLHGQLVPVAPQAGPTAQRQVDVLQGNRWRAHLLVSPAHLTTVDADQGLRQEPVNRAVASTGFFGCVHAQTCHVDHALRIPTHIQLGPGNHQAVQAPFLAPQGGGPQR